MAGDNETIEALEKKECSLGALVNKSCAQEQAVQSDFGFAEGS